MKEKQYIRQLEDKTCDLIAMLTEHSLYSFLSDGERKRLGEILKDIYKAKNEYKDNYACA
jgi:hypothetical protein